MKAVVLWTGGKDSYLALCSSISKYEIILLVTFVPKTPSFKAHPIEIIKMQATSLKIPSKVFSTVDSAFLTGTTTVTGGCAR